MAEDLKYDLLKSEGNPAAPRAAALYRGLIFNDFYEWHMLRQRYLTNSPLLRFLIRQKPIPLLYLNKSRTTSGFAMSNRRHMNSHLRPDSLSYAEFSSLIENNGIMQARPLNGWTRNLSDRLNKTTACEICNKDFIQKYTYSRAKYDYIEHEFWSNPVYTCEICENFMCTLAINLSCQEILYDTAVKDLQKYLHKYYSWKSYGDKCRFLPSIVMTNYFGPIELYRIQKTGEYRIIGNFLGEELLDHAGQPISADTIRGATVKILDGMTRIFKGSKEAQGNYRHIPAMQKFFGRFCDFALKGAGRQYEVYVVRAERKARRDAAKSIQFALKNAELWASCNKMNTIKRMMLVKEALKKQNSSKDVKVFNLSQKAALDNEGFEEVAPASRAVN